MLQERREALVNSEVQIRCSGTGHWKRAKESSLLDGIMASKFPARESSGAYRALGLVAPPAHYEAVRRLRESFTHPDAAPFVRPVKAKPSFGLGPSGRFDSLESRRVHEHLDPLTHVSKASAVGENFHTVAERPHLSADCKNATAHCLAMRHNIRSWRTQQLNTLRSVAASLEAQNSILHQQARATTPRLIAGKVHVALLAAIVDSLEWPDNCLPVAMLEGMPVVGQIEDTGVFRSVVPDLSPHEFEEKKQVIFNATANDRWNLSLESDIRMSGVSNEDASSLKAVTDKEIDLGFLSPYLSKRELDEKYGIGGWRAMRRFGVWQNGKLRAVDDGKSSSSNTATYMLETIALPTFEFPAIVAQHIADVLSHGEEIPDMEIGCDDLFAAYRRVPTSQPQFTVIAIFCPIRKKTVFSEVYGHNFGLLSAVTNFSRVPALLTVFAQRFFACMLACYIDDYIQPELKCAKGSGQFCLKHLHYIVEFELSPSKRKNAAPRNIELGVMCDMSFTSSRGVVSFSATETRKDDILGIINDIQSTNVLSSEVAAILVGKSGFLLSTTFGRVGRAALQPAVQRIDESTTKATPQILKMCLFFEILVKNLPPREILLRPQQKQPLLIYTDASSNGSRYGLGIVVIDLADPSRPAQVASALAPEWLISRLRNIYERDGPFHTIHEENKLINPLELVAAASAYYTFPDLARGRQVLHFIDNTAALSSTVHGYSSRPAMADIVTLYHLRLFSLQVSVWHEWVPSKANIADIPSRTLDAVNDPALRYLEAVEVPFVFTPESHWIDPSSILR